MRCCCAKRSTLIAEPLEQIQMLSPVNHFARRSRPSRSALMVGRPRRDRYYDHRQRKNHREPKSETIWCLCHLFPSWQQTEIGRLWRAARQAHRKHRAFAQLARHGHVAAHHARELAGDGKAEARAAEALSGRGVSLDELLEQLCLLLSSHANASVSDGELNPAASVGDPTRLQLDLTLFGELAGIAQQIEQYLSQPHGVHVEDTQVLLGVDNEVVLVLIGKLSGGADDLVDQRC